jgi:hypothetical protein
MASSNPETTASRSLHPAASAQIEGKLAERHIDHVFEPNLRVADIRDVEGNQVRLGDHRAPKDRVDRYAQQMKAGAVFPAIVVNDRYELIDGNTRRAAALENKQDLIAAYICSDVSATQARSLSVELNQAHGLSMTENEVRAFVDSAVREGQVLDPTAYARMTGTRASRLARWVAAAHFQMRTEREGILASEIAGLPDSSRVALHAARLSSVFVGAVKLAAESQVPATQLKATVSKANSAASEAEALAVIAAEREARATEGDFKKPARRSAGSALHIGGLLRFEVDDLLDVAPEKQYETFMRLRSLLQQLDSTVESAMLLWDVRSHPRPEALQYAQVG